MLKFNFLNIKLIFNEETFLLYKHWAYVTGVISSCSLLSEELREIGSMYQRAIAGIPAVTPIDKFSYDLASRMYSEPVGIYYGEKYFGEEAKKDITEIVLQIIDTYKTRIKTNEILGEETREKAILKLSTMGVKMGYPDKVDSFFDKLVFDEKASLFDIVKTLGEIETKNKEQAVLKLTMEAYANNEGDLDTLPVKIYYPAGV